MRETGHSDGFVRSDNRIIASSIAAMGRLVLARGGYVHPAAGIEERDGSLRTLCHAPLACGQPLFTVPDDLLVPIADLPWSDCAETLQLTGPAAGLSPDQAELLDMFIAIYNATDKLAWVRRQPAILLSRDIRLAAQVDLVRPGFAIKALSPAAAFLETRSYSSKHALAGLAGKPCIMPLIDFMNHHLAGSKFRHGSGQLQVDINYPTDSEECFVNYGGHRDPLDIALVFGYPDRLTPYAHSVPATIDIAGFGRIEVTGKRLVARHRADPPKVEFLDDGLSLSQLSGNANAPHHLQGTLRLAMMASGKRRGIPETATERALVELPAAVLAANREKLSSFQAYLATRPELPFAPLLAEASALQLANLEKIFASPG